ASDCPVQTLVRDCRTASHSPVASLAKSMCIELRTKDIARAAGVRKHLFNRYFRCNVFIRVVGEVSAEGCFQIEFSILYKLKCGDCGEHLVHRSESEARLQSVRRFLLTIRQSIRLCKNSLAISCDENST